MGCHLLGGILGQTPVGGQVEEPVSVRRCWAVRCCRRYCVLSAVRHGWPSAPPSPGNSWEEQVQYRALIEFRYSSVILASNVCAFIVLKVLVRTRHFTLGVIAFRVRARFKRLSWLALFLELKGRKLQLEWFYNDCDCLNCYKSITLVSSMKLQHLHEKAATLFAVFGLIPKYFGNRGTVTQQSRSCR